MMAAVHPSADLSCDVAIHLSDTEFTSRIDYADAYVLPTTSTTAAASADATQLPTATLVSPWLLVSPSVCDADPSSSPSVAVTAAGTARRPAVETVPLAWRCPSCGTLEVEQLYWRRPQRSKPAATDEASTAAAVRAALARSTRLKAPSPALQAKLERHRWRRERREEMRWRPLHISARCRSCFLCPRCGGHGSLPFSEAAQVVDTSTTKSTAASSSLFPTAANVLSSTQSVSSLDIRLTSDVQYYAVCMCCQWHSYRAFPTMEQLLGYLDAVMGDEKAETLRERRAAQRSLNTALRAGLTGLLGVYSDLENHVHSQHQQQQATVSQAAWDKFRHLRSAHIYDRSAGLPSHLSSQQQQINGKMMQDAIMHLHPALALEQLRHQEQQRQEAARAASLLQGVSQAAPQAMRVVDLAREAAAKLQGAQEGEAKDRTPLREWPPAHHSTPPASVTAGSAKNDVEVNLIARTQQWFLGLPLETVDTRRQSIQTWMQRYQPAAVVAQERKTAAAAAAAATTSTSALMHTPTSAYLHSVLLREQDRPLGLPAYYIPRVRKELLTALVWRLPPAFAAGKPPAAEQSLPCTRLVLLDRHALSDEEVRQVCQHWVDERTAQVERHERKRRSELEQQNGACSTTTTAAGKQRNNGDGGFDSDGGDEEDDNDEEGIERPKGGASQDSMHPATAQHPPPQQRIQKSVSSKLPLPLFLDGTDFSALSCLPFLEYVRSGRGSGADGGNAHLCEWQFRLMSLHMMHDVYLTRLEVVQTVIAPSCAVDAPHGRPSPFLSSASAACVTVQLSSSSVPAVELPVALAPRCSPEERAAALAAVLQGRDGSRVGDAGPSPPLSIPSILTMGITTPPTRLPELHITLRDTSATQAGEPSSPMRTPLRCVELLLEVLTALTDVEHAHPQYHAVRYGLVVTLDSC